jgi:hypothetical protein
MCTGTVDKVLAFLRLQPYRCRKCLNRFFRFRTRWAAFAIPAAVLAVVLLIGMAGYTKIEAVEAGVSSEPAAPSDADRVIDSLALTPPVESPDSAGAQSATAPPH